MKKYLFTRILDGASVAALSFLILKTVSLFYLKNNGAANLIATCLAIAASSAFILVTKNKARKLTLKKSDEKVFSACKTALLLMNDDEAENLMRKALKICDQHILTERLIVCKFTMSPVSADDLLSLYKKARENGLKLTVYGVEFSDSAITLAKALGEKVSLCDMQTTFTLLKGTSLLPSSNECLTPQKPKLKDMIISTFDKRRARGYTLYGCALLILSRFVFYPIWYIISGCLFLVYALSVKFFANDKSAESFGQ